MTNEKPESPRLKINFLDTWLAASLLLFIFLTMATVLLIVSLVPSNQQTGVLLEGQIHSGEDLQASLDLGLAKQASFPSNQIGLVKDLGTKDNIKTQIINFGVPVDNLTEYALLKMPSSPPPVGGFPVIILCHGYISPAKYKTTFGYLSDMDFYARHGFAVIKPDFRGQGLSSGQGKANSAYYSMNYNTDLMSLISAVKQTPYLDSSNLNLWGHSMGAYIAFRASVVSNDVKAAVLLSSPIASLDDLFNTYIPPSDENNSQALKTRQSIFKKYGTPGSASAFWAKASPTNYINQTSSRYQIHVGLHDTVVPPQLSSNLDSELNKLKRTHEFYTYDEGLHSLQAQRSLIWARSLKFLNQATLSISR